MRRPLFGRHGRMVVAVLCGYELAALTGRCRVPTISQLVRQRPALGVVLLAALAHHFFAEEEIQ